MKSETRDQASPVFIHLSNQGVNLLPSLKNRVQKKTVMKGSLSLDHKMHLMIIYEALDDTTVWNHIKCFFTSKIT